MATKLLFLSTVWFCAICSIASQLAIAQYQTAPVYGNGYAGQQEQKQRKMTPNPLAFVRQTKMQPARVADRHDQSRTAMMAAPIDYSANNQDPAYGEMDNKQMQYGSSEPSHPPMPFDWGYDIKDTYGNSQFHKESNDEHGKRTGSYGYTDAYGVYRRVYYVADENGFRASIKTNEPGTSDEPDPADVDIEAEEPPAKVFAGNRGSGGGDGGGDMYASNNVGPSALSEEPTYGQPQRSGGSGGGGYGSRGSSGGMGAQRYAGSAVAGSKQNSQGMLTASLSGRRQGMVQGEGRGYGDSSSADMFSQYAGHKGANGLGMSRGGFGAKLMSSNMQPKQMAQYNANQDLESSQPEKESDWMSEMGDSYLSGEAPAQQQLYGSDSEDSFNAPVQQNDGTSSMAVAQEYGTNSRSGLSAYSSPANAPKVANYGDRSHKQEGSLDYRKVAGRKIAALMRQRHATINNNS